MKNLTYAGLATSVLIVGYFFLTTSEPSIDYPLQSSIDPIVSRPDPTPHQAPPPQKAAKLQPSPQDSGALLSENGDGGEKPSWNESEFQNTDQSIGDGEIYSGGLSDTTETSVPSLRFAEADGESADATPVDTVFAESGTPFNADLEQVANLHPGDDLTIELLGQNFDANIKAVSKTDRHNRYVEIKLNKNSALADMTIYYGRKVTKGVIYTSKGTYMFQHDGTTGYLLNEEEFEKQTGIADKTESPRYKERKSI